MQRGSVEGSIAHRVFVLVTVSAGQPAQTFKWAGVGTHQNKVHWGNPSAAPPSVCTLSGSGGPTRWTDRHLWENDSITERNIRDAILPDTLSASFLLLNKENNSQAYFFSPKNTA